MHSAGPSATCFVLSVVLVGIAAGGCDEPPSPMREQIQAERAKMQAAPGRTGILAEPRRYSLFDEELVIRDFFQDRRGGFFVDVGCAWPIRASNSYYLERHLDWTGIGIDALDDYAAGWAEKRPGSHFFAYLVSDESSPGEVFYKSEETGLSSVSRGWADGIGKESGLEVEEVSVPAITLNDLLDRLRVEKIDLLALDIEGHELPALRGIDLDRFQPELIVVEGERKRVIAHLDRAGYVMLRHYLPFDSVNRYFARRGDPRVHGRATR